MDTVLAMDIQCVCVKLLAKYNRVPDAMKLMDMRFVNVAHLLALYGALERQGQKPHPVRHEIIDKHVKDLFAIGDSMVAAAERTAALEAARAGNSRQSTQADEELQGVETPLGQRLAPDAHPHGASQESAHFP
jgi:hypothetical protein